MPPPCEAQPTLFFPSATCHHGVDGPGEGAVDGGLVVACEASGSGVGAGASFVEAEFVIGGAVAVSGALFTLDGLLVDGRVEVSVCWLHPHNANPTNTLATAI